MLKEPGLPYSGPGYQSYAAITMCRALYALKFGTIVTKPTAVRWAIMTQDKEWTSLIEAALAWHDGDPAGDIERTKEFMRYTMEKTGVLRP